MNTALTGPPEPHDLEQVVTRLLARFGENATLSHGVRQTHANSLTWVKAQIPDIVVFPATTDEVAEIVKLCAAHRVPVIPFGTGTSFEGHVNAPWGGVSVDTSRMSRPHRP